jgi:hypothetical protein
MILRSNSIRFTNWRAWLIKENARSGRFRSVPGGKGLTIQVPALPSSLSLAEDQPSAMTPP